MSIELGVFNRDHGIDEVARQLVVRNGLAVLDVNLAKDLLISIQNHAGRFHLLKLFEIEGGSLSFEIAGQHRDVNQQSTEDEHGEADRDIKVGLTVPRRPETIARRWHQIVR